MDIEFRGIQDAYNKIKVGKPKIKISNSLGATLFDSTYNWERMSMSTAQGSNPINQGYYEAAFDGRYIYYGVLMSVTMLRFDTKGSSFATVADWQRMSLSTALGAAVPAYSFVGTIFDGRYVYHVPFASDTFLRFDTQGTSFTTTADWQRMSMSTAQGAAALDSAYTGAAVDSRYVYFCPRNSYSFIRFDTQGTSFTTAADWQRCSETTALGGTVTGGTSGAIFDGRYVYYAPLSAATFVRFDTLGTSFTTAADWQKMSMSTAQGAAALVNAYDGVAFDGRYVYYVPYNSDTFLRFDTQGTSFTTAADWQKMSMSTAQGAAALNVAYQGAKFDGRYIHYSASSSDTFLRFDTKGTSFTTPADWQKMNISTAQGSALVNEAFMGTPPYDGRYVYHTPSYGLYFIRHYSNVAVCPA